jgi:hypothetical protein
MAGPFSYFVQNHTFVVFKNLFRSDMIILLSVPARTRIRDTPQIVEKTPAPVPNRYNICGEQVTWM